MSSNKFSIKYLMVQGRLSEDYSSQGKHKNVMSCHCLFMFQVCSDIVYFVTKQSH